MVERERIIVECLDFNHQGQGVCKPNSFPIFVDFLLIGEIAEIEIIKLTKNYGFGKILKLIKVSADRVKPPCPAFGKCGGCEIMHMRYDAQLAFKQQMGINTLKKIAHLRNLPVSGIVGMDQPFYYRNKVQIPFQKVKNQVICGFFKKNSHEIFPMERCFIQPELATKIALFVGNLMNQYQIPAYDEERQSGCLRHVLIRSNSKNEFMLVLVTNTKELPHANQLIKSLQNEFPLIKTIIQNINNEKTNVVLGKKNLVHMGSGFLREELLGLTFAVSPHSFFQTNYEQTSKLYRQVLKYANPQLTDVIVDGYCGVGTIAVFLARFCKRVVGIEIVKEAVQDARANALLNNISNVEFIVGKTEEEIYKFSLGEINILIIDPPRKGCAPQLLQAIIEKQIPKIVYVSCNVATLARDLAFLSSNYEIKDVTFFDMFPQISDVEICVLLQIT